MGPAGPLSPLAPSRPLKPCAQNQSASSGESPLVTTSQQLKVQIFLIRSTNSLCVPWCQGVQGFRGIHELPGKRGGKQDQHLMRDNRPVNMFNVCFSFLEWAGGISSHLRSSSSTLTGATSFARLTLLKTHREEVSLYSSPLIDSKKLIYDIYQKDNND